MAEMTLKIGKKADEAKAGKSTIADSVRPDKVKESGASAQRPVRIDFLCWNCWASCTAVGDTNYWVYVRCWNCNATNEI